MQPWEFIVISDAEIRCQVREQFDAANRPAGWNTWLTFAISPAAPTDATPTRHLVTK